MKLLHRVSDGMLNNVNHPLTICMCRWSCGMQRKERASNTPTNNETTAVRTRNFFIVSSPLNEVNDSPYPTTPNRKNTLVVSSHFIQQPWDQIPVLHNNGIEDEAISRMKPVMPGGLKISPDSFFFHCFTVYKMVQLMQISTLIVTTQVS
jgi:hypothetical protein